MFQAEDKRMMRRGFLAIISVAIVMAGCKNPPAPPVDNPRLTSKVVLRDVTFHSPSLNREISYRAIFPASIPAGKKLAVVYLLHGGAGSYRDWSNYTDVARYAEQGFLLIMPEGGNSYYTNAAGHPEDRFEDYIVKDLVVDVEGRFPVKSERRARFIVGVSMGGYGAIKIALKHPELYAFAAGLSSALDVPSRPFSFERMSQWRGHAQIFGPWGSAARRENDPFLLVLSDKAFASDPPSTPYIFIACGDREGLLGPNRRFANLLKQQGYRYEFHTVPGGNHDWNNWSSQLPALFNAVRLSMRPGE
jgi:putative tributyrin esterase